MTKVWWVMSFFYKYGKYILVCIILALLAAIGFILFRLTSRPEYSFATGITEITGNAVVRRNGADIIAYTGMYIQTDDVVFTLDDSNVKLKLDNSKFIYLEPNTSIYFTVPETATMGSHVIVNLTSGAVYSEISSDSKDGYIYEVKTPNSIIRTSDCIFRTSFAAHDNFDGKQGAYVTALECYYGDLVSQLYDNQGQPVEGAMKLLPTKSSELITTVTEAFYNYLNQDIDLNALPGYVVNSLIAASATRSLEYSLSELNAAVKRVELTSGEPAAPVDNTTMSMVTDTAPTEPAVTSVTEEQSESETTTSEVTTTKATTTSQAATTRATTKPVPVTTAAPVTKVTETTAVTETTTAVPQTSPTVTTAESVITGANGRVITTADRWWDGEATVSVTRRSTEERRVITTAETTAPVTRRQTAERSLVTTAQTTKPPIVYSTKAREPSIVV